MGGAPGEIDLDLIDASAPGLAVADLIFIFGSRLPAPAGLAADLFNDGLAPLVVVTGGSERQPDGLNEAEHHHSLLVARGVPDDAILIENRSSNTVENVMFALPLILARCERPKSVIAVVKRYHRRALLTLAHHMTSVDRIYAATYEPDVLGLGEAGQQPGGARQLERRKLEVSYVRGLLAQGFDPLLADGIGWRRTLTSSTTQ